MNLPKGSGLELLSKMLSKRRTTHSTVTARNPKPQFNPLQSLMKNMTSAMSQLMQRPETDDYDTITMSFAPSGAKPVKPQYPKNSERYLLADLDGDSRYELTATYKHSDTLKTIILKKQDGNWYKTAEVNHPEYDTFHYRGIADMAGDGKPNLLLGLSGKGKPNSLNGYALTENTAKKIFDRNYDWVELAKLPTADRTKHKPHIAVWSRNSSGMFDIDLLGWNGTQLEPAASGVPYYYKRVVPFYMRKLRQNPYSPHDWYYLADAMKKAGIYGDALRIAQAGSGHMADPGLADKFKALRDEVKAEIMELM